jgi:hypothetical protein
MSLRLLEDMRVTVPPLSTREQRGRRIEPKRLRGLKVDHNSLWLPFRPPNEGRRVNPMSGNRQRHSMIVLTPGVIALMPCCILTAPGPPDRESHELIERITPDNQRGVMYLLGWRYPPYR